MKLTINKAFNILNLILPQAIDGKRILITGEGALKEVPRIDAGPPFLFAPELKHRDLRNRRKLREALEAFTATQLALAERMTGKAETLDKSHPRFKEWNDQCQSEAMVEEVEVDLRPYKLSQFRLEKNEHYPSAHLDLLDQNDLIEFDIDLDADAPAADGIPVPAEKKAA